MALTLSLSRKDDALIQEDSDCIVPGATWYVAEESGLKLHYAFPVGALADCNWLAADILLDGVDLSSFHVLLQEGEGGREFMLRFGVLNQVQARIRFPLDAVDQSRWQTGREAAYLKPMCGGDIVDLAQVDRMKFVAVGKGEDSIRFALTDFQATVEEPERLTNPVLPRGPICDAMGQSIIREWPGKTRSVDELVERLQQQLAEAPQQKLPDGFSRWGGCKAIRFESRGFFTTQHDGTRWWLVDPDGCAFWSLGIDCVRSRIESYVTGLESAYEWLPAKDGEFGEFWSGRRGASFDLEFINFLGANLKRAFGDNWHDTWSELVPALIRRFGFNTVANWSEWQIAQNKVPYVRPLALSAFNSVPKAFRDLCDVFEPSFETACREYAKQLEETKDDPAFIGYFLMNEPTWGFAAMTPAKGMLFNCPHGKCRQALADWLREKYTDDEALSAAWEIETSLTAVADGPWHGPVDSETAEADLAAFSSIMIEKLYKSMCDACKAVDPNHLNLGARYYTIPPEWAVAGMRHFDVFSINGYKDRFPSELITDLYDVVNVPIMIGEWHYGALDVGLPGGSLRRVADQKARGEAYRVYAEGALAHPACVGIHYFTLYDEAAMGRFDGENWNIGFLDVCHRSYAEHETAARKTHERMYDVATGTVEPYDVEIEYLPMNTL